MKWLIDRTLDVTKMLLCKEGYYHSTFLDCLQFSWWFASMRAALVRSEYFKS